WVEFLMRVVLMLMMLSASCFHPDLDAAQYKCSPERSCPYGFICMNSMCQRPGASDMSGTSCPSFWQSTGIAAISSLSPDVGQADLISGLPNRGGTGPSARSLSYPAGVFWDRRTDGLPSRLYISELSNHRVVGYRASSIADLKALTASDADVVLGQNTLVEA